MTARDPEGTKAKLLEAARQAARGLAATIEKSGRVPLRAVFGASANSKPEPAAVPDRAPSCAAVAVWATLLRDSGTQRDDQLTRSLGRTIAWLTKQQAPSGAWFEAYPPDAPPGKADRIVRLDLPGYRDATLALLLATQTVDNKVASAHAQKSIDLLLKLRIDPQTKSIGGLWRAAALPDGEPAKQVRPLPAEAFSALATRHAMHTLLAAYFLGGKKEVGLALDLATKQIDPLQRDDGLWDAFYDSSGQAVSATQPAGQSRDEPAPVDAIWARSTFGLDELIRTTRIVRVLGKEKFVAMLEAGLPLNDNIAMLLCGLTETVGTASLPVSADEVDNFIEKNASLWTLLEGPPPPDIQGKVRRLGVLLLRDRVERTRN